MKQILFIVACLLMATPGFAKIYEQSSPNGLVKLTIESNKNSVNYSVNQGSTPVLSHSTFGMKLADGKVLGQEAIKGAKNAQSAKFNTLRLNYGKYAVVFRVYDEGVAYRFETAFKDSITIEDEMVNFRLPGDYKVWAAPANSHDSKTSDLRKQVYCSFENTYVEDNLSKLSHDHLSLSPVLVELTEGKKLLLCDYNVSRYPGMFALPSEDNTIKAYFPLYPKTEHQGDHNNLQMIVDDWQPYIAKTEGTRAFPWKMMLISTKDADLITATMPRDLADAPVYEAAWAKPGKVAWDWWNAWNLKGVDFKTGVNNDTYKYYIDFAAKNNIEYVILDEGWSVNKKADLMQVVPEINLPELAAYAKKKGVDLVLWAGYRAFDRDMENVCKHYSEMGIKGFKIDFMDRNDQEVMEFLERAARTCAKYHLFCDFHGAPTPNGMTITYPNVLNFEAVFGQEQAKWASGKRFDQPRHENILPFIRQVVGPMDYTQGAMRNANKGNYYPCYTEPMSQGTRSRQLALFVIFDSPFSMLCDAPTAYEENPECTDFIAKIPVTWDERRVLCAKVGEYVVEACRKGDTWYIGGITNWEPRDFNLDLSWLTGKTMTLYKDGLNADKVASDYKLTTETVPATFHIHMAPGGGFAAVVK